MDEKRWRSHMTHSVSVFTFLKLLGQKSASSVSYFDDLGLYRNVVAGKAAVARHRMRGKRFVRLARDGQPIRWLHGD